MISANGNAIRESIRRLTVCNPPINRHRLADDGLLVYRGVERLNEVALKDFAIKSCFLPLSWFGRHGRGHNAGLWSGLVRVFRQFISSGEVLDGFRLISGC